MVSVCVSAADVLTPASDDVSLSADNCIVMVTPNVSLEGIW